MSTGDISIAKNGVKNKKFKKLIKIFTITFVSILAVFVVLIGAVVIAYNHFNGTDASIQAVAKAIDSNLKQGGALGDLFSNVKERTNFLILGVDGSGESGARTDFMMAGCFNSKTKRISFISIPRDTYVVMPEERRQILKNEKLWTPSDGAMKINEVAHYAGEKYGTEFAVKQVEELLNIEIEYYVKIDLDAFKYLIDEVGGVEFDVPQRMIYDDPEQKLHIDLQAGLQTLNGAQSEGVIRYRKSNSSGPKSPGYAMGDLQRVKVQQDFMKALTSQIFSSDKIMGNADALIKTAYKYLKTNVPITDVPKYLKYLTAINTDNIDTCTLPGVALDGSPYYYMPDGLAISEVVDDIYYSSGDDEVKEESSVGKKIQVLNGTNVKGLASSKQKMLEEKGFTVDSIGDYDGVKQSNTRIVVKKKGQGGDLQKLFEGSKIEIDKTVDSGIDILIILGTSEN